MVYHEARNVRFPIERGRVPDAVRFRKLVELPRNREEAWRQMRKIRDTAIRTKTSDRISKTFRQAYEISVDDLAELYARSIWKDSPVGGNAWGRIALAVGECLDAFEAGKEDAYTSGFDQILSMTHNTGIVGDKLAKLRISDRGS
jgi:hypothetical protein